MKKQKRNYEVKGARHYVCRGWPSLLWVTVA